MKKIERFICEVCKREYKTEQEALICESSQAHIDAEKERKKRDKEIQELKDQYRTFCSH